MPRNEESPFIAACYVTSNAAGRYLKNLQCRFKDKLDEVGEEEAGAWERQGRDGLIMTMRLLR